mmetsp:Transcript_17995/g.41147  ORF Transcript_17995/g.41147 Transcript_17995/m.41147 type:complete len:113 (+) Transcript_17995:2534-2872(+)
MVPRLRQPTNLKMKKKKTVQTETFRLRSSRDRKVPIEKSHHCPHNTTIQEGKLHGRHAMAKQRHKFTLPAKQATNSSSPSSNILQRHLGREHAIISSRLQLTTLRISYICPF